MTAAMTPVTAVPPPRVPPPRRVWWPRVWLPRLGAAMVALVGLGLGAMVAFTEPVLTASVAVAPAPGSVLDAPPVEVSLTFPDGPAPREVHLTVVSAGGTSVARGPLRRDGRRAAVSVATGRNGSFSVGYHVEFADGRTESGLSGFAVTAAPPASVSAASVSAAPSAVPATVPSGHAATVDGHAHAGADPFSVALAGLDALLVLAVAVLTLRRPRTRPTAPRHRRNAREDSDAAAPR